ncbi:MAG TPA: hypothetical protein VNM70_21460 [Burkholderiales bacterium]|nr:hypothetical protein [Burkholderiales bacterium]
MQVAGAPAVFGDPGSRFAGAMLGLPGFTGDGKVVLPGRPGAGVAGPGIVGPGVPGGVITPGCVPIPPAVPCGHACVLSASGIANKMLWIKFLLRLFMMVS